MSGPPGFLTALMRRWTWSMAWRDSRRSRGRLLLFSSSIVLGIAAMVAIGSFGRSLERAVEDQSKALLGADLQVNARQAFDDEQRAFLDEIGVARSYQTTFTTMLSFPFAGGSRLVQVRSLTGGFPYYGEFETEPADAVAKFRRGLGVLIEENLLLQFNAKVGDFVQIGAIPIEVVGALKKVPGENMVFATVAPRVYLPEQALAASGLIGNSSIARYRCYFKVPDAAALAAAVERINVVRAENRWGVDTVEERKEELGNGLRNLHRFLNLVGFVALLLGAIGIASAIQLHVREKLHSVGVLRCLGCSVGQTFAVYLIQGAALGLTGALAGALTGIAVQRWLPEAFADFLPLEIGFAVQWGAVGRSVGIGFGICMLFAMVPLLGVRRVSPLIVLRRDAGGRVERDPWLLGLYAALAAAVTGFACSQTPKLAHGLGFVGGLAVAILLLLAVAWLIGRLARLCVGAHWPFVVRQGLANLYRPNNRTSLLLLALGLGTFMILTIYLAQFGIVRELMPGEQNAKPNAILFDVQADQVDGVKAILADQALPVLDVAPVVTMRISAVKGQAVKELLGKAAAEPAEERPRRGPRGRRNPAWVLRREYRCTYRETLADGESLLRGEWVPKAGFDDDVIPVSVEEGIARDLGVDVGDEIEFDVQGLPLKTRVANLRKVEWRRVQANFFVVFPAGVLEDAPGFSIITTRVPDSRASADMQSAVARAYPNVSSIDLMLVIDVVNNIISKITFGVRFMAFFTALTGVLLLITATLNSRYQRFREGILLRTLGASRGQILRIQFVEFSLLGIMASGTGVLLAVGGQWAVTKFVFEVPFVFPVWHVAAAVGANYVVTILVGIFGCWGITNHPPLALLRAEA